MIYYKRYFGWENHVQQRLEAVLNQRFDYFIKGAVVRSETPLTDEVDKVLELLEHNGEGSSNWCVQDWTPILGDGQSFKCAMGHIIVYQ